LSIYSN